MFPFYYFGLKFFGSIYNDFVDIKYRCRLFHTCTYTILHTHNTILHTNTTYYVYTNELQLAWTGGGAPVSRQVAAECTCHAMQTGPCPIAIVF